MTIDHTDIIDALYDPTDWVEVRLFDPDKKKPPSAGNGFRADQLELDHWIAIAKERRLDAYLGINPRSHAKGTTDDETLLARCLFVDWDGVKRGDTEGRMYGAGVPLPTAYVESGGGYHAYWRLADPLTDLGLWTRVQKAMIKALGSDRVIHNPSRVMRMPGSWSFKRGAECRLIYVNDNEYSLDEFPDPEPERATVAVKAAEGEKLPLTKPTLSFCIEGAGAGSRNDALFKAACDFSSASYSREESEAELWRGAQRCDPPLTRDEFDKTLDSVFSKPRVREDLDDLSSLGIEAENTDGGQEVSPPRRAEKKVVTKPADKPRIGNTIKIVRADDDQPTHYAKPIDEIQQSLAEATGGWPRRAGGQLFVMGEYDKTQVPTKSAIRMIDNHNQLFAWMHQLVELAWQGGGSKSMGRSRKDMSAVNVVTRPELHEHLKDQAQPHYQAIEFVPHIPTVDNVFYVPFDLPPATGEALQELMEHVNAETPEDKDLMLAALLTPAWGGPCGKRPAFVFTSQHGRGVGKTETAELFCGVYGGRISLSPDKEDWDKAKSRLLSDDGLAYRCVIIDNVKAKLSGADVEGLITSPVVDGHKMYQGQRTRPNRLTYYLTANTPRLSQDLATRSVIINVGASKHSSSWPLWVSSFLAEKRLDLLADILEVLRGDDQCRIETSKKDRWAMWMDAVLTKFANGNELADLIRERRGDVDADNDQAEEIREAIEAELEDRGHKDPKESVVMSIGQIKDILADRDVVPATWSSNQVGGLLRSHVGSDSPLAMLTYTKKYEGTKRRWIYSGAEDKSCCNCVNLTPKVSGHP